MKQLKLFKNAEKAHGGSLRSKRKGRRARPIATKHTMHLVLRSSHAKGKWRFQSKRNTWKPILRKFAAKYGVRILSVADPGNHIHLHIQLTNRYTYNPFIRAVTAAIAMAITGASRWKKVEIKFWDKRPFTRVVIGRRAFLTVSDYLRVNELEAQGDDRRDARQGVKNLRSSLDKARVRTLSG